MGSSKDELNIIQFYLHFKRDILVSRSLKLISSQPFPNISVIDPGLQKRIL